jgi:hypothetical protein
MSKSMYVVLAGNLATRGEPIVVAVIRAGIAFELSYAPHSYLKFTVANADEDTLRQVIRANL